MFLPLQPSKEEEQEEETLTGYTYFPAAPYEGGRPVLSLWVVPRISCLDNAGGCCARKGRRSIPAYGRADIFGRMTQNLCCLAEVSWTIVSSNQAVHNSMHWPLIETVRGSAGRLKIVLLSIFWLAGAVTFGIKFWDSPVAKKWPELPKTS